MIVRTETPESFPVKHLAVIRVGNGNEQFGPFLKTSAIEVNSTVFGHYPMCIGTRGNYAACGIERGYYLVLALVGAGSKCGDGFAAL